MAEITAFATSRGIKPATVLQIAAGLSGTTWDKWCAGSASCSMRTAERIRSYMADNAPSLVAANAPTPESTPEQDVA